MARTLARTLALLALASAACGARTDPLVAQDAALVDAPVRDVMAADQDPGRPCGCPGTAGFQRCFLPRMCCPVTRTCEDPAHFNCSGSDPPACR